MNILRYVERLKRMDTLIKRKATGTPEEFARKMGLSRSTLMEYIKSLKALNAPIVYDTMRNSYYYDQPCRLKIGFESTTLTEQELQEINNYQLEKICKVYLHEF